MKTASKILIGISAVLLAAFAAKNIINYTSYSKTVNSAPFDLAISLNALFFVLPAAILAAIALFLEKKTRVLAVCAALFAAVCIEELTRLISVRHFADSDGLFFASPYIASAVIFAVFLILSELKSGSGKTLSTALFVISGAIAAIYVFTCLNQIIDRRGIDNIMQLFAGLIIYSIILLVPAYICAYLALLCKIRVFMAAGILKRGGTILLIAGAVLSAALAVLVIKIMFWYFAIPALISAAVCVIFAVHNKKRGNE